MDPFGDGSGGEGDVPADLNDFQVPADNAGDFYEVEPVEAPASESHTPMETPALEIPVVEEDNELTKFMAEYEVKIAAKTEEQEKVAVECKSKAEEDMAQFLAERERIKEAKMQSNRVYEQATLEKMAADLQSENPWERVVTLVDLETNHKQKQAALKSKKEAEVAPTKPVAAKKQSEDEEDVSRMRHLFVQLKAQPLEKTRGDAIAAN